MGFWIIGTDHLRHAEPTADTPQAQTRAQNPPDAPHAQNPPQLTTRRPQLRVGTG